MKKLTGNKSALIDTMYIGEYATYIYTFDGETSGNIYQCNGTQLDDEGKLMALKLKCDGYEIDDRTMSLQEVLSMNKELIKKYVEYLNEALKYGVTDKISYKLIY